jgi:TetR/AcrR family transcriptional regulator
MSRRRDKEATRREIMEAASELFAANGFADTSLSDIAERADVTKSLIHHHFGSKEKLWNEVSRSIFDEYESVQKQMIEQGPDTLETYVASIRMYAEFLEAHPEIARMHGWMALEDVSKAEFKAKGLMSLGIEKLTRAQKEGAIRDDIHPVYMLEAFIFLMEHWVLMRGVARHWLPDDVDSQQVAAGFGDAMIKILTDGIRARSKD